MIARESQHRAVITGIGVVSALGIGRAAFWEGICAGGSAVRPLTLFDTTRFHAKHAAWIDDDRWTPERWIAQHRLKRMDRCTQFAVVAAKLAVDESGLELSPERPNDRAGVSFGTALGGFAHGEQWHQRWLQGEKLPPGLGLQIFPGSAQGNLAIEFGLRGQGTTNANTCAAGNVALGDALRMIQSGVVDVVLAGASETPVTPMIFATFDRMGAMSAADRYRPLHAQRDGFIMGEGSAMFVVESLDHAQRRGATILAEVLGFAATNEAHHMSTPEPGGLGLQVAMRRALADAGVNATDIDYLNAHASGTPANDENELRAIRTVFGEHTQRMALSGTKPFTGHTLGAAGALEIATCVLAMQHGAVPPTLNLDRSCDAAQDFHIVAYMIEARDVRCVMTNSLGFGGIDTSLVLRR